MISRRLAANAGAFVAAVLFGSSVVAVRVAVQDVPPLSLAVLRFGQGGLLLVLLVLLVVGRTNKSESSSKFVSYSYNLVIQRSKIEQDVATPFWQPGQ